jgi:anti-sigma B factor antagonist
MGARAGGRLRVVDVDHGIATLRSAGPPTSGIGEWPAFSVQVSVEHGAVVVRALGELDIATVEHMRDGLTIAAGSGLPVRVDLSNLTFIDASGLGALVAAHNCLLVAGRPGLTVGGASSFIRRLFEYTDLTFLLDDGRGPELDAARREAGMSIVELFVAYFALGGTCDLDHLLAYLAGSRQEFEIHQRDIVVHAINERLIDLTRTDQLLSYAL